MQNRLNSEISEKEELLKELESANGRTEKSQKQLSDANQKIDKLQIEIDSVVKINGEMNKEKESVINIYQPIFDSLIKCDSMKSFVRDEMGITSTKSLSIKDSIVLANYIGRGFFFARKIVEHMTEYKKVNTERLTSDEISLIHAINEYYKKADDKNNEIDALDCLGLDIKEKVKYDRKKMRDIREPRNTDFVEAVEMYVPALYMENGGDIEKKALIKGE